MELGCRYFDAVHNTATKDTFRSSEEPPAAPAVVAPAVVQKGRTEWAAPAIQMGAAAAALERWPD